MPIGHKIEIHPAVIPVGTKNIKILVRFRLSDKYHIKPILLRDRGTIISLFKT